MSARLAQSVEHGTLNPGVVGSSPTLGANVKRTSLEVGLKPLRYSHCSVSSYLKPYYILKLAN